MANDSKPPSDSPQLTHFKSREADLGRKLTDLDGKKAEPGFDYPAAKSRTEALLAEVRKEIKALQK